MEDRLAPSIGGPATPYGSVTPANSRVFSDLLKKIEMAAAISAATKN